MAPSTAPANSETTAFPSFLDTDPFPTSSRDDGRPSSSATDATSDFGGDDFLSAKERQSVIPSTTGPVGEPGLPPSRPSSVGTSAASNKAQRTSMQPPASRRGFQVWPGRTGSSRGPGSLAADGSDSRPGSSMSKTHVPSLTPQGFFKPLSSQKLQAQRNQRPQNSLSQAVGQDRPSNEPRGTPQAQQARAERSHRHSNASVRTLKADGRPLTRDEDAPPLPVSRGTMFTDGGGQTEGYNTAASVTSKDSVAPLQGRPSPLQLRSKSSGLHATENLSEKPRESPRSLRASLRLGSLASRQDRPSLGREHEKLESNPSSPNDTEKRPDGIMSGEPRLGSGRNYEYFAGNMLFFLSGRCLNTKAKPLNMVTFVLTILPTALFFAFSAPWLWHHASPAVPIIFAYIFYIAISSLARAAFTDPGILPRNLHPHPPNPEEDRDPLTPGPPTTEWIMVKTFPSSGRSPLPGGRSSNVETAEDGAEEGSTQAMEVPTKYCKSCDIWRPPRAHHCRICDSCIETQDHHCVWLNNCVGRRNYRYFFTYVGSASVLCLLLMAFCLLHVGLYANHHHISFAESLKGRTPERVAFALFIYSLLALPYPGSLFIYHTFLVGRGETTREYLNSHKFPLKDRHRPFTQSSLLRNWASVLLRPRPPTYMQFKRRYHQGDVRLGYDLPKSERQQRVKDLSKRYSVQGHQRHAPEKDVEMKNLPALPPSDPQQQMLRQENGEIPSKTKSKGPGGVDGPLNRTPR